MGREAGGTGTEIPPVFLLSPFGLAVGCCVLVSSSKEQHLLFFGTLPLLVADFDGARSCCQGLEGGDFFDWQAVGCRKNTTRPLMAA